MRLFLLLIIAVFSWMLIQGKHIFPLRPAPTPSMERVQVDLSGQLLDSYTPEEQTLLEESGITRGSIVSEVFVPSQKLHQPMAKAGTIVLGIKHRWEMMKGTLVRREEWFARQAVYALLLFAGIMTLLWFCSFWRVLRGAGELLFGVSHFILTFGSILSLVLVYAYRMNPWHYAHGMLFWLPAGFLAISAGSIYLLDQNTPLWRTLYSGLLFPALAGAGIMIRSFF